MICIDTRQGTKEYCESLVDEIKAMGYEVIESALVPLEDAWGIAVSYNKEE